MDEHVHKDETAVYAPLFKGAAIQVIKHLSGTKDVPIVTTKPATQLIFKFCIGIDAPVVICNHGPKPRSRPGYSRANVQCLYFFIVNCCLSSIVQTVAMRSLFDPEVTYRARTVNRFNSLFLTALSQKMATQLP